MTISGSTLRVDTARGIELKDSIPVNFGNSDDATMQHDPSSSQLTISGSLCGTVISGSVVLATGPNGGYKVARTIHHAQTAGQSGVANSQNNAPIAPGFTFLRPTMAFVTGAQLYAGDSGALVMFDQSGGGYRDDTGIIITLPDAGEAYNLGSWYTIANFLTGTSVKAQIRVSDTGNETIKGFMRADDLDTANTFFVYSSMTSSAITFNGSTSGYMGSMVTLVATSTDQWNVVDARVVYTGNSLRPFVDYS